MEKAWKARVKGNMLNVFCVVLGAEIVNASVEKFHGRRGKVAESHGGI